jgi:glycosyltransferase involved in cell wall biosynthesis
MRGGCENYALTVAGEATSRGWTVVASFPRLESMSTLAQDFAARNIPVMHAQLAVHDERQAHWKHVVMRQYMQTLSLLLRTRPTVVQLVLSWPVFGLGAMLACATWKIPVQVVFQLVMPGGKVAGKVRHAYHWAHARNQQWIAVSQYNRNLLANRFDIPADEIAVIHNGVDPLSVQTAPSNRAETQQVAAQQVAVRRSLGIPEDGRLALSVGRLEHQKGLDRLPAVVRLLRKEWPNVWFAVAGDGSQKSELVQVTDELGIGDRLLWLGHRTDIPRLLAGADVFLFPTRGEGHPFALVEAMAAGLPVIASDNEGIGEIVEHLHNGLIVDPDDAPAFANAIAQILSDPAQARRMADHGRRSISRFSGQAMLDATLDSLAALPARRERSLART